MTNRQPKVVVLDDSEICRATTKLMLEEQGFVVIPLSSPLRFSGVMKSEQPDIALIDVGMPALQGDQLVSLANRHGVAHCPMVLFSDRSADELTALVRQCGAAGFIRKSDSWESIGSAVRDFIHRSS